MVALLVALTFIAALIIDAVVRRGKKAEERMEVAPHVAKAARPAVRPTAQPAPAVVATSTNRIRNVLVVDDEKTVCNSCKKILSQEGYQVDFALSGEEALNKVKGNRFDVMLTDWKMPEMDGLEVARRVKKENPNITVIMITGYPSLDSSIEAIRSGISDYVPKPFTPEELSDALVRASRRHQAVATN